MPPPASVPKTRSGTGCMESRPAGWGWRESSRGEVDGRTQPCPGARTPLEVGGRAAPSRAVVSEAPGCRVSSDGEDQAHLSPRGVSGACRGTPEAGAHSRKFPTWPASRVRLASVSNRNRERASSGGACSSHRSAHTAAVWTPRGAETPSVLRCGYRCPSLAGGSQSGPHSPHRGSGGARMHWILPSRFGGPDARLTVDEQMSKQTLERSGVPASHISLGDSVSPSLRAC